MKLRFGLQARFLVVMAAMPEANKAASSPRSYKARRSSTISLLG